MTGLHFNPISKVYWLGPDTDVNYMVACRSATAAP
jgi:2-polyprenyl-3-methyl-5-hydroxy-6-metoxy-1,4-benzoquinol methylase